MGLVTGCHRLRVTLVRDLDQRGPAWTGAIRNYHNSGNTTTIRVPCQRECRQPELDRDPAFGCLLIPISVHRGHDGPLSKTRPGSTLRTGFCVNGLQRQVVDYSRNVAQNSRR